MMCPRNFPSPKFTHAYSILWQRWQRCHFGPNLEQRGTERPRCVGTVTQQKGYCGEVLQKGVGESNYAVKVN